MTRDDIRRLLGGYATDSLSEAERKILFDAALDDQELFDELAQEQALKEVLEEPGAKQRLIAALAPQPKVLSKTWWARPWPWVAVAGAVIIVGVMGISQWRPAERKEIAEVRIPTPSPDAPPVIIPAPPRATAPSAFGQQGRRQEPALVPPTALRKEAVPQAFQDSVSNKDSVSNQPEPPKTEAVQVAPASPIQLAPPIASPAAAAPPAADAIGALSFRAQEARAPEAAAGGGGGGRGGRGGGQQAQAGAAAQVAQSAVAKANVNAITRFAFDYAVTPEGRLRIVPTSDGFLTVSVSNGDTSQVVLSNRPVLATSPVEVVLPVDSTLATIVLARTAGAVAPAVLGGVIDPPSGTKTDPAPSPNSQLRAIIQLPPRQ